MVSTVPTAQSLLAAAAAARQGGRVVEEQRLVSEALRLAPENPQALNAAGMIALGARDHAAAARHFAAAAARDQGQPALWMNLATATRGGGDAAGEEAALDKVVAIDPHHLMARLRLAQLHQRQEVTSKAVPGWRLVLQLAARVDNLPRTLAEELRAGQAYVVAQNEALAARLDGDFADVADAPDGARIRATIDHVVGRRAIYRNECHGVHVPFLPAYEYFNRRLFPWMAALEARTDAIRAEAQALMASGSAAIRPYVRQEPNLPENKWSALDQSLDWSACFLWEYGARNEAVCALCPETVAALEAVPQTDIPGRAPTAFFSILRPHAHIPPHTGVTNARTIVHLPLIVPDGCRFRVGGETRSWREGEAFAFDDTIEHEAWNDSDDVRVVLILDVWNPYLTPSETQFLRSFFDIVDERPREVT